MREVHGLTGRVARSESCRLGWTGHMQRPVAFANEERTVDPDIMGHDMLMKLS